MPDIVRLIVDASGRLVTCHSGDPSNSVPAITTLHPPDVPGCCDDGGGGGPDPDPSCSGVWPGCPPFKDFPGITFQGNLFAGDVFPFELTFPTVTIPLQILGFPPNQQARYFLEALPLDATPIGTASFDITFPTDHPCTHNNVGTVPFFAHEGAALNYLIERSQDGTTCQCEDIASCAAISTRWHITCQNVPPKYVLTMVCIIRWWHNPSQTFPGIGFFEDWHNFDVPIPPISGCPTPRTYLWQEHFVGNQSYRIDTPIADISV